MTKKNESSILLWTLSYLKPFKYWLLLYLTLGMAIIWCELAIPRRIGSLIDQVLPDNNQTYLLEQIITLGGIVGLLVMAKALYGYLEMMISNRISGNQQHDLLCKLYELGFSYAETVPTGEVLSIFQNSVKETQQTYTFLLPQLVYCTVQFVVPSVILLVKLPQMLLASVIGHLLYMAINSFTTKKIEAYQSAETNAVHKSHKCMYDAIFATEGLRLMGSGEWFIAKTMDAFNDFRRQRMGSLFWRHFRYTSVGMTLTLTMALFYWLGFELITTKELMLGELIGYSFLMGVASRGFSVFFYIIPAQKHALKYAKHLYEFMHQKPLVEGTVLNAHGKLAVEPLILRQKITADFDVEFKNVSFRYSNGRQILDNVSFKIPAGKKTAIVGESGSGKSTLLKLIGRFYDVTEGEINLIEHSPVDDIGLSRVSEKKVVPGNMGFGHYGIKGIDVEDLREGLGFVFQENHLFNTSVRENIRFGKPSATNDEVVLAAKNALVHDFVMAMPDGYDTKIGERGVKLSGGQKQRLALARLILKSPSVILLDEATSALDEKTQSDIKTTLNALSKGKTVVAIAHRLSTITDYDNIVVINSGRIVEEGDYQSLMLRRGHFYDLVMRGEKNVV